MDKTCTIEFSLEKKLSFLSRLMTLYAYPMIVILTIAGILVFPFLFTVYKVVMRWTHDRIMRALIWLYGRAWIAVMSPFVSFRRQGFEKSVVSPPYVIVVNHYSFFDTYCMALLPFHNVAFAVRAWPFKMLWYAPFMRLAHYLNVEDMKLAGTLSAGAEVLQSGASVLFFPEGHRSTDGKLQRFFSGPFKLACETGIKVLPLCITGTDVLLPPGRWTMRPANIRLKALPPIDPSDFVEPNGHMKLLKHVKDLMAKTIAAIQAGQ
jgi:1-acyl-sn-glycerol-3-phosphate acyltransferase